MTSTMNRNRFLSEESPSIASYGMGETYASASQIDGVSIEVSDVYADPLSLKPTPKAKVGKNAASRNRVSFRRNNKQPPVKKPPPKKKRHNPSLPEPKSDDPGSGKYWKCYTRFATFLIPDCLICLKDKAAKQAWREKIAIFEIFLFSNIIFLFIFGVIPLYFCRQKDNVLSGYSWFNSIIDDTCNVTNYASLAVIFSVAVLLGLQCICSLYLGLQSLFFRISSDRPWEPTDFKSPVMVLVPCYNEGDKELGKTINSILETNYPSDHKVLVIIADGIITGKGEYFSTPATLARLLGFTLDSKRDQAYSYKSLGHIVENRASVYSGIHERDGKLLKYVVIVKRGTPAEKESSKPGNRGKRDSQLIALGLFNRVHHDRKLSDLDGALVEAFNNLGVPVKDIDYMLAIDADTRISIASICHMVYKMNHKHNILACCGETKVDNKASSWVTMIQVYEYFASHHLKKSFESVFGCVTCLPGCFTMYRMTSEDGRSLISADSIFQNYARNDIESLHEKNLFHLGEDRMLTTLLLKLFPDMSLSFVPIASCWTIVPDKFNVLLSQRRRWINSTFHNMWELMKVNTMCGFLCISMNTVVIIDTISFLILPASIIYGVAYTYAAISGDGGMSLVTIILYAVLFGAQIIIFLARSRFDYLLWFLIYLVLGVPVFYFILPVYSFWHMDDFSWGTTRQVAASKKGKANATNEHNVSSVPKQEAPMKKHKKLSTVEEERSGQSGNTRPRMTNEQKAISALTFDDEYPSNVSYNSAPMNYMPQELSKKKPSVVERLPVQVPSRNVGPIDLDEEPVPPPKKSASIRSDGPVDLDDSPSPKKKIKDQHFLSFGSFDGEDEVQTFEDLYEGSSEPSRIDI